LEFVIWSLWLKGVYMSVEGVGVGVGVAVSVGPSLGSGPSLGGIEAGGFSAPMGPGFVAEGSVGSLAGFATLEPAGINLNPGGMRGSLSELNASVPITGSEIELTAPSLPIFNGSQVGMEDFKNTMPITTIGQFNGQEPIVFNTQPVVEASVEVEEAAKIPQWLDLAEPQVKPVVIEQASVIVPGIEPLVMPIAMPKRWEGLEEETETEGLVNAQSGSQAKIGSAVSAEAVQTLKPEPVLEEQEQVVEQVVATSDQQKAVYKNREETEESRLKDVVDEEVLIARVEEFAGAIEEVDIEVKAQALENGQQDEDVEIDGGEVVSRLGSETPDKRSGLVKKQGPDGSRIEAIEEIRGKKFKSAKEAKEKALATVFEKRSEERRVGKECRSRWSPYH